MNGMFEKYGLYLLNPILFEWMGRVYQVRRFIQSLHNKFKTMIYSGIRTILIEEEYSENMYNASYSFSLDVL